MGSGTSGSVSWTQPGYYEPGRSKGNRMFTDYSQDPLTKLREEVSGTKPGGKGWFRDRRWRDLGGGGS